MAPPAETRNTALVSTDDRDACPPKNETICSNDASTFHQFGRQLRPEVRRRYQLHPQLLTIRRSIAARRSTDHAHA
ncbi:hypothetical protein AAVH_17180 [Aphelenchoides avenae]|nr:hypothetical protein AAVH_17180 [Aphelenchus avenae]